MKKVVLLFCIVTIMVACSGNKANNNAAKNEIENTEENVEQTTETAVDSSEEVKKAVVDTTATDTTNVPEKEDDNSNL